MIAKVVLNSVQGLGIELVEKGRLADDLAVDVLRGDLLLGGVLEERAQLGVHQHPPKERGHVHDVHGLMGPPEARGLDLRGVCVCVDGHRKLVKNKVRQKGSGREGDLVLPVRDQGKAGAGPREGVVRAKQVRDFELCVLENEKKVGVEGLGEAVLLVQNGEHGLGEVLVGAVGAALGHVPPVEARRVEFSFQG